MERTRPASQAGSQTSFERRSLRIVESGCEWTDDTELARKIVHLEDEGRTIQPPQL